MKILVSPAHYILDSSSVSEFYYASTLLYGIARNRPQDNFFILCGFCADKQSLPKNIYIYELFRNPDKISLNLFNRLWFYLWILFKSIQLSYENHFDIIWHVLPNGRYSFNLFILFGLDKLFRIKRRVIGRLAHSYGEDESNVIVYENGNLNIVKQGQSLVYKFLYLIAAPFTRIYFKKFDLMIFYNEFSRVSYEVFLKTDIKEISNIIPVGVSLENFPFRKKGWPAHPIRFLYAGNLIPRKRVGEVLKLISYLKACNLEVRIDIVGDGYEMKDLVSKTEELNLQNEVKFHGFVPKDKVRLFYDNAHILLLLSDKEAFGHVILEAWSSGTMVICSNIGVFSDLITQKKTGYLFDPTNKEEVLNLSYWIKNLQKEEYGEIIQNSREESEKYSWPEVIQKYEISIFG